MTKLPKNFPEYSLLYKNLNKKITDLQKQQRMTDDELIIKEIQSKIKAYQKEMNRIKSLFPEGFFKDKF
ncbi:MAG: hypothetical protein H2B00_08195 [Nitrosopumilaceae archaeon]|jgi:hypothetical protein|uniref:Uncharacterized protein n=1 Tax=Candidatus Nitrosomaritimum aestuariumsis TaxID=3342354 RepID=A0AC60WAC8_9ARCH|nr:hypothetical protein [Nitrosopumilaceae archaeon]MBA4462474.1 hypothetical protein [Nitrosopumilaceae archaeon]MBA4463729.1 hypothetical protein [Nitrosopumilaceae archaeon]